ncbi:MAG TPA: ScyD/ScyE family protein [Roseiflexaceae bacterium]|nr:ScyD/ScyE family protein [Roseiflexaceae bacterium]
MSEQKRFLWRLLALGGMLTALLTVSMPVHAAPTQASLQVVASNLDNPRGLSFGPDDALYVAEAGRGGQGPCTTGEGGVGSCFGLSGAVTRVISGTQTRIATNLPSLAAPDGSGATGPQGISFLDNGYGYLAIGLGNAPEGRALYGAAGEDLGHLLRITTSGARQSVADVSAFEGTNNPDQGDPKQGGIDTNPFAVLALRGQRIVADAGGNDLLMVSASGVITTVAVFPSRMVPGPGGQPPEVSMQAVPNSIALGPDGAYYVGELTGFPFPVGGARVYRVVPGRAPQVYATGFTNIIGLQFDSAGNMYVLEHAVHGLLQAEGPGGDYTGALVRVSPTLSQTTVISTGLTAPTGIAISPAGGIYISNNGVSAGNGQVVRVVTCAASEQNCQEPKPLATPLAATLSGASEVDASGTPNKGDPDASGNTIVTLNTSTNQVCIQAMVSNVAQISGAHIHQGAAGVNGPIVVNLSTLIVGNMISGCVVADPTIIQQILTNPGGFYFNVHNADFPSGAARGQLASAKNEAVQVFLPTIAR